MRVDKLRDQRGDVYLTCPCGTQFRAWKHNIKFHGTHTGKCRSCRVQEAHLKRTPPFAAAYRHLQAISKRRNIHCLLTFDQFLQFTIIPNCFYCSASLIWRPRKSNVSNLDRKDSTGAYETTNVVACCGMCNRLKGDRLTFEQMLFLRPILKSLTAKITEFGITQQDLQQEG